MGKAPHDWDIATSAKPDQIEAIFPKTVPVGKQFGIIIVIGEENTPYEVATFRGESTYSDGRHPDEIRFVGMREDVKRRDFTVNALLFDPISEELLDFVEGEKDLKAGILRAVGDPIQRFQEDRLRILRAIRFAANLGFRIDEKTWKAVCQEHGAVRGCVSQERIREELEKMLVNGASQRAFALMDESGLLDELMPELAAERGVEQPPQFHPEGDVWQHEMKMLGFWDESVQRLKGTSADVRFDDDCRLQNATAEELSWLAWAVLLHDIGKPKTFYRGRDRIHFNGHDVEGAKMALATLQRLRHSTESVENICYLIGEHMNVIQLPKARIARQRRSLMNPLFPLLLELLRLDTLSSFGILDKHKELVALWQEEAGRPHPAKPTITGADLLSRGFETGPRLGKLLQYCADYELEHPFADHDDALRWLDQYLAKKK